MSRPYENLMYLARCYFHQDFSAQAATPLGIIDLFVSSEVEDTVRDLRSEIDEYLLGMPTEASAREIWLGAGEASYEPSKDGMTVIEWFKAIQARLAHS